MSPPPSAEASCGDRQHGRPHPPAPPHHNISLQKENFCWGLTENFADSFIQFEL